MTNEEICECGCIEPRHYFDFNRKERTGCLDCGVWNKNKPCKKFKPRLTQSPDNLVEQRVYKSDPSTKQDKPMKSDKGILPISRDTQSQSKSTLTGETSIAKEKYSDTLRGKTTEMK